MQENETPLKEAKQSKQDALINEKVSKLVISYAMTTLVALIMNTVYNLTDTLFVSWGVGDIAMGGVSVVFPLVLLQGAISTAIGGGAASLVSRRLGEGKKLEAGEITLNAMLTFYITAIITTALGFIFMEPMLKLMGVTDEIYPHAKSYLTIILIGNIFSTGFSSIIRAECKMLYALLIWVIPITINIIFDAIFILVFGWGVKGAAAATVICQFASSMMSVIFFTRLSKQSFKGARPQWRIIGEILSIGLPSLVQMGSLSIISIILNNAVKSNAGTIGITSLGYINKLTIYAVVPFTAITQALSPIVGYNYGAGNMDRVKKTVIFSLLCCTVYAIFAVIIIEAIPQYLLKIFTANCDIITFGKEGLRIITIALFFTPIPMLLGATMQATGKKLWALLMYASNLIFLIPTAFLMAKYLGINGVWWSYVIASFLSALFALTKMIGKG